MTEIISFLTTNATLLVAMLALVVSLYAARYARRAYDLNARNKLDADRVLLFDRKRELLNEVDKQHVALCALSALIAQKSSLICRYPVLQEENPGELQRLTANLAAVELLGSGYKEHRRLCEATDLGADIPRLSEILANIRQLTIHLEKDIALEKSSLDELRLLLKDGAAKSTARGTTPQSPTQDANRISAINTERADAESSEVGRIPAG